MKACSALCVVSLAIAVSLLAGCPPPPPTLVAGQVKMVEVARSPRQWTGVAVSKAGRVFVSFPRWTDDVPMSVAEVLPNGTLRPFPHGPWNTWKPGDDPKAHFVCVQSVHVDSRDFLWILDPANPKFAGVVPGGPKLLKVDLRTDEVVQVILFNDRAALPGSYLNDVRIDAGRQFGYVSDSGTGAILVVNLRSGRCRRVLVDHPATKSQDVPLRIGGKVWRRPDGSLPQVHVDGIALDPVCNWLYFQPLTGRSLYRVLTMHLRRRLLTDEQLGECVQRVGKTGAADGLAFDAGGNLYMSALEHDAIMRWTPDRRLETVIKDPRIVWPDSFAVGADGTVYFTTSQIHLGPNPPEPYRLFRLVGFD
jgi:sugar lactone lactonase YvrE